MPDSGWDALGRGPLSQRLSVFGRRHARSSPERAGEARLRGKPALESNLAERRAARRDHCPRGLQPPSADVAMRRHARGGRKCAGEMIDAETRDIGKVGDREVFSEMLFDVCENTPQPSVIQPRQCQYRQPNELRLGVRVRQSRRKHQRRRFHEHAARGGRDSSSPTAPTGQSG